MELWIRSQDEEVLMKVDILEIEENMIIAFDKNKYQCLGTYKSKKRALEILNEIQSKLKGTFLMKMKNNGYQNVIPTVKQHFEELNSVCIVTGDENFDLEPINKDIYVYEMPKE